MNNLDVAMCHLMGDCLGATCEIKVSACCSRKYSHNNMFKFVYMVDVHIFYIEKLIHCLQAVVVGVCCWPFFKSQMSLASKSSYKNQSKIIIFLLMLTHGIPKKSHNII